MPYRFVALIVCTACLLVGCPQSVTVNMNPQGQGFYQLPWPNDTRLRSDGALDLRGFPPALLHPLLGHALQVGARITRGFGTHAGTMFTLSGPLDQQSLPSVQDSTADTSPVQLVNLNPQSARYRERIPVRVNFDGLQTLFKPGQLLTVMPYPGYGLEPKSRYAVLLFNGLRDSHGQPVRTAPFLQPSRVSLRRRNGTCDLGVPARSTARNQFYPRQPGKLGLLSAMR